MINMEDITLIGKVTGSTPNMVELEYPSVSGINSVRLARTMVARFERLGNDRVAVLVRPDDSERGQQLYQNLIEFSPLHITEEQITVVDDGPFDNMLFSGGRLKKDSINWDFDPVRKPVFVMYSEGEQGSTVARANDETGEPVAYAIFNPLYASEKRPAGAYLGTFSPSYYPMAYRTGFGPALEMAAEKGWPAQVIAWNEGKAAALFVDATSSVDWEGAGNHLGQNWKDCFVLMDKY